MAALSALAEHPDRIIKIFTTDMISQSGLYYLQLFLLGEPIQVAIDDYLPCTWEDNKVAFAKSINSDDIWPCLVEKAYAKLFGTYENLIAGFSLEAFGILTGAPTE